MHKSLIEQVVTKKKGGIVITPPFSYLRLFIFGLLSSVSFFLSVHPLKILQSSNYCFRSSQNATADAAATLRESTLCDMGMRTT